MAQTREGALKVAAGRVGISPEDYAGRVAAGQKWCFRGKHWQSRASFGTDRSRSDGLTATCEKCRSTRTQPGPTLTERRRQRANGQAWCRGCERWLPSGQVRVGVCRWHANEEDRRRYSADPRYRAERRQHSHARKRLVAPIPADGQEAILEFFDGKCAYCGAPATTWDHIEPVTRGGQTLPWNVVPACASCNSSKHDADLATWLSRKGFVVSAELIERMALEHLQSPR